MNNINLIGRLTRNPELRYTNNNKAICEFDLAVNRRGQDETDFITCVIWEKQAENLQKYQSKGSLIAVSGSLRVDKYQNQEGQNRYKTYVLANNIEYLSSKSSEEVSKEPATTENKVPATNPYEEFGQQIQIDDSDLPF